MPGGKLLLRTRGLDSEVPEGRYLAPHPPPNAGGIGNTPPRPPPSFLFRAQLFLPWRSLFPRRVKAFTGRTAYGSCQGLYIHPLRRHGPEGRGREAQGGLARMGPGLACHNQGPQSPGTLLCRLGFPLKSRQKRLLLARLTRLPETAMSHLSTVVC